MATYAVWHEQAKEAFDALVLEVPFMSLLKTADAYVTFGGIKLVPLDLLMYDTYDTSKIIDEIKTRILVMGTNADKVIPPIQAKELYELAENPKKIIMYDGVAHDKLYDADNYNDILRWLESK